jgi:hypothetical protein
MIKQQGRGLCREAAVAADAGKRPRERLLNGHKIQAAGERTSGRLSKQKWYTMCLLLSNEGLCKSLYVTHTSSPALMDLYCICQAQSLAAMHRALGHEHESNQHYGTLCCSPGAMGLITRACSFPLWKCWVAFGLQATNLCVQAQTVRALHVVKLATSYIFIYRPKNSCFSCSPSLLWIGSSHSILRTEQLPDCVSTHPQKASAAPTAL